MQSELRFIRAAMASCLLMSGTLLAQSIVTGNCRMEMVKGRTGNYVDMYEWNIYLSRLGADPIGQSYRVGTLTNPPTPHSYYAFLDNAGEHTMFLDQPLFFGRPKFVGPFQMGSSGTLNRNVEPAADYLCGFGTNSSPWGNDPWTGFSDTWYQTFMATGTSISCVSFKVAGSNTGQIDVSLLAQGPGNVTTWSQAGQTRRVFNIQSLADNWVRLRSGEWPTTPGTTYAIRFKGVNGLPDSNFACFRRIEDGQGYAAGQAFSGSGQGQNFDLYAHLFSDNDGTVIPYCMREHEGGDLASWAGQWSQQIKASGTSLAGAVLYFAGGSTWNKKFTFKVRTGGPNGAQVGPAKTAQASSQTATAGLVAASWSPGEVPLTPGQVYFLEATQSSGGDPGFNPHKFTKGINAYGDGEAYMSGTLQTGVDLFMQVLEHVPVTPPTILRTPSSFMRSIPRGAFAAADTLQLSNSGGGVLSYAITDNMDWLAVSPANGTVGAAPVNLSVGYSTAALAMGQYSGTITITSLGATNTPQTVPISVTITAPQFAPGDLDHDGDVDQADFGAFQRRYSGAGVAQNVPACLTSRLDGDDDVDLNDFATFQACVSGTGVPANTLCGG